MEVSGPHVGEPPAWGLNYRIGNGSLGTVFLEKVQIRGMKSPELWAVKRISRTLPHSPAKRYQAEIRNLQALSNYEWFVKFNASYLDADYLYIAMEYVTIGDISKTFVLGYQWNESDTKVVIEQLLHGLAAMHKEGILHGDLKPETVFLCLPEDGTQVLRVKIGGFSTSKHIPLSDASTDPGTTNRARDYMAPEMDNALQPKTQSVDIWSLGCILYRMITGGSLFNSWSGVLSYTVASVSPPPAVEDGGFSVSCVGFLRDVLQPGPEDRPNAQDCLKNPWILSKAPGLEYSIGWDLYNRLSKIRLGGPNIDSFSNTVADRGAEGGEVSDTNVGKPPPWRLNYPIGSGFFGDVFLERIQTSGMESPELWAVKKISRTSPLLPAKRYQAEIQNLQALSNYEWFVKFYASFEDSDYVYIAMEYIAIGDISKTFVHGYQWNESDTKVVIEQLLHGLVVMHKEGITHRDLKPENIFLCLPEGRVQAIHVKIGDFGASKRIPPGNTSTYLKTTTGTLAYMAPEMIDTSEAKSNKVDIWALGCILYRMFAGSLLFKDLSQVYKYTMTAPSLPPAVEGAGFSGSCIEFLRDVLQPNPEDRPSAEACFEAAWIRNKDQGSEYSIGEDLYTRLSKMKLAAPSIDTLS